MKKISAKTVLALIALPAVLSFLFSCRNLTDDECYKDEVKKISSQVQAESLIFKKTDFYYQKNGSIQCDTGNDGLYLYFTPDGDIPYVEPESFLNWWFGTDNVTVSHTGSLYKMAYNDAPDVYISIDFSSSKVFYSDLDYFFANSLEAKAATDILGNSSLTLSRKALVDIRGADAAYSVNLKDYNIPLKYENNYGFIPLNTILNLTKSGLYILYNGKTAFLVNTDSFKSTNSLGIEYSSLAVNIKKSWSQDFAALSYNTLCLTMDMFYGRKEYLGVTSFDKWFTDTGLKKDLYSTDIINSEKALATLLLTNIGDLHTYYHFMTPYLGLTNQGTLIPSPTIIPRTSGIPIDGPSGIRSDENLKKLSEKFTAEQSSSVSPSAEKYMNIFIPKKGSDSTKETIFLTFTNFESDRGYQTYLEKWKYEAIGSKGQKEDDGVYFFKSENGTGELNQVAATEIPDIDAFIAAVKTKTNGYGLAFNNQKDTILLTVVANYIIKELNKDSSNDKRPINNVVLDLSLNGGGANDDEIFFSSWFLGKAISAIENKTSGSKSAVEYICDVNFDGKLDSEDNIANLKRYCITSLSSFSCGNLLPSKLRFDNGVKSFGRKSGGGTCAVKNIIMPSGSYFSTSSFMQICTLVNGSFVDIDDGIDVDVPIARDDFNKVYNRYTFCAEYLK